MLEPNVIIDTNVVVSALRSKRGASFRLISLLGTRKFIAHLSVPLFLEYQDVCHRDFAHSTLTPQDISVYLNYLCSSMEHQTISFLWRPILPDPKDDMVLEIAVSSQSTLVISYNDKDFVGVNRFGIDVLTPSAFLRLIGEIP